MKIKGLRLNPLHRVSQNESNDSQIKNVLNNDKVNDGVKFPSDGNFSQIKCKIVRRQKREKFKREKAKAKREARKLKLQTGEAKQIPHTIESLREKDETIIHGSLDDPRNEQVKEDIEQDEFASYYRHDYEPKVLITYSDNPTKKTRIFGRELTRIIPNSISLYRNRSGVKKMVRSATAKGFTDIIIVNENRSEPNGLLIIHLPDGPTLHCKLSNVRITPELKRSHKEFTNHYPEVILNNFTTRLGHSVGRMLGALFHYQPEFKGRRVVTFHNQRDYIFFRHHRYEFNPNTGKPRLRELGPRFTLKVKSLQYGTFDSKFGDFEWIIEGRRHEMETSRRKFFL